MVTNIIYPSLLKSANLINTHSWFNIYSRRNDLLSTDANINSTYIDSTYQDTYVIVLNFTSHQTQLINEWLNDVIDVYNLTNEHIKQNIDNENAKSFLNFIRIRKELNLKIANICSRHKLNKHTADYSVKHCVEMYKSSFSNHKNVNKFNIKNMTYDKRRKNLVVEKDTFSKNKNSFFYSILGEINSNIPIKNICHNSVLQFDSHKKSYKLIVPVEKTIKTTLNRHDKCGIDIGVRTFLTTYSVSNSYEIGTNTYSTIDKYNKKIDNLKQSKDNNNLSEKKFKKAHIKYSEKIQNKIKDMHNKCASFLVKKYKTIIIGNVSTKKMASNLTGNLQNITKRRLMALSHFRFREKLKNVAKKYKTTIIETNEYMTSKKCSQCETINDMKSSKIYKCKKCKLTIDRDINAAINIYNK